MFDAATDPVAAVQPDPNRAEPNRALPASIAQVLGLVRTFIAYGKNLADTLRQHAADPHVLPCFAFVASVFNTGDLALILARITRGLLRAAALEARLSKRAARGRDLKPMPLRLPSERKPGDAKPATPPDRSAKDPSLARLPTPEEIVAKDRRRPIGAVLLDICLDLGIAPGQMDPATREELRLALMRYGYAGSLIKFLAEQEGKQPGRVGRKSEAHSATGGTPRLRGSLISNFSFGPLPIAGWPTIAYPAWPVPFPQSPAPACIGPP